MRKYYDPEYDRTVDETEVRRQYDWFKQQSWFHKSFEEFAEENFEVDDDPDDDHIDEDIQAADMAADDMPDNEDIPFC